MRSLSRSTPFRSSPTLFLLAALPMFGQLASADVLTVGPIYLNGSGSFSTECHGQDGEGACIDFDASGSNGVDSITIGAELDTEGTLGLGGILAAVQNPATAVGSTFGFGSGPLGTGACFNGTETGGSTCFASVDGIGGVPLIGQIGGVSGSAQLYQLEGFPPNTSVGPLLAEADVITTNIITNVYYLGPPDDPTLSFSGTFVMVSPEPRTGLLALIGLFGLVAFRKKSSVSRS